MQYSNEQTALLVALKSAGLSSTAHFCASSCSYDSCWILEDLKTAEGKRGGILEVLACVEGSSC